MRYQGPETEILHERYATALFDIAQEAGKIDEVWENLQFFNELLKESADLRKILAHPGVSREEKLKALKIISGKRDFCGEFRGFIQVLAKNDRLGFAHGISLRYRDFYDKSKKRLKVFVKTAVSLSKEQTERIKGALKHQLKKDIMVEEIVDPRLIGGLDIRIGDMVYNRSLDKRLKLLKEGLGTK